jgi:probable phosphoglycerate mutase
MIVNSLAPATFLSFVMNTHILLVRHGQSTFNAEKRFQGCSDDSVLTEQGHQMAYQTGLALSHLSFTAAYTSPLQRAQQTAQGLLSAITTGARDSPQLHVHPDLAEIDLPLWQGRSYQEVRQQFAEDYEHWKERPHTFQMAVPPLQRAQHSSEFRPENSAIATVSNPPPPSFPVQDLFERARRFWQEILPRHSGERILVISHGGAIRALISTAIALDSSHYHTLQQSNGGISSLTFANVNHHAAQLNAMNLTNHLGEILPKLKDGKQGLRLLLVPVDREISFLAEKLIQVLSSVSLAFCTIEDSSESERVAHEIVDLRFQPIVQLPVSQQSFLHGLHQTIHVRRRNVSSFSTGLVVANVDTITSTLHHILHLSETERSLHLRPGTITALYYPASANYPVLQTMNLNIQLSELSSNELPT